MKLPQDSLITIFQSPQVQPIVRFVCTTFQYNYESTTVPLCSDSTVSKTFREGHLHKSFLFINMLNEPQFPQCGTRRTTKITNEGLSLQRSTEKDTLP